MRELLVADCVMHVLMAVIKELQEVRSFPENMTTDGTCARKRPLAVNPGTL